MSLSFLDALLAGRPFIAEGIGGFSLPPAWPDDHDRRFLELRLNQMRGDESVQLWLARAMVLRRDPLKPMAGHIGFHEPPRDGVLEMGYTVMPRHRRQGYAHEAVLGMMRWAHDEHGIRRFRVSIAPDNAPSLALAAKLGFERTGEQMDPEDGLEYVFELGYTPEAPG
jgi:RimJ/RimL family protein N-acetyltransferase